MQSDASKMLVLRFLRTKNPLILQSQPSIYTSHMRVIPGRLLHILEEAPGAMFPPFASQGKMAALSLKFPVKEG
jgi:hypothetical protein